jgi:hypothetical protein
VSQLPQPYKLHYRLSRSGTGGTGAIITGGGTAGAGPGIAITIAVGGMPIHGGSTQYHARTAAVTIGTAGAAAIGAEAPITADACAIIAAGPGKTPTKKGGQVKQESIWPSGYGEVWLAAEQVWWQDP